MIIDGCTFSRDNYGVNARSMPFYLTNSEFKDQEGPISNFMAAIRAIEVNKAK